MAKQKDCIRLLFIYLLILLAVFIFFFIIDLVFTEVSLKGFGSNELPRSVLVLLGVFAAPLIETFLFQFLIYEFSDKFFKRINKNFIFLLSAGLFASTHAYSWFFMLYAFFMGLLFIVFYHKLKFKFGTFYSFFGVIIIHSLFNLILFIFDPLFEILFQIQ
jgi:uncharacterized protein